MVACLAVGSQGGYKPKCRTIYETAYTTQYEQRCSTSYKTECSTSYVEQCSTDYETSYEEKVHHYITVNSKLKYFFSKVLYVLRGAMFNQLRDVLWREMLNHLQRGTLYDIWTMLRRNLDRSALVGTEAMAAMGSSVRRFPSRGASRCLYRSQWLSVPRSPGRTANK